MGQRIGPWPTPRSPHPNPGTSPSEGHNGVVDAFTQSSHRESVVRETEWKFPRKSKLFKVNGSPLEFPPGTVPPILYPRGEYRGSSRGSCCWIEGAWVQKTLFPRPMQRISHFLPRTHTSTSTHTYTHTHTRGHITFVDTGTQLQHRQTDRNTNNHTLRHWHRHTNDTEADRQTHTHTHTHTHSVAQSHTAQTNRNTHTHTHTHAHATHTQGHR